MQKQRYMTDVFSWNISSFNKEWINEHYTNGRGLAIVILWSVLLLILAAVYIRKSDYTSQYTNQIAEPGSGVKNEQNQSDRIFKKISISLDNTVFQRITYHNDQNTEEVIRVPISKNTDFLLQLCLSFDLFVLSLVNSDEEEKQLIEVLDICGAFNRGLKKHHVLTCSTAEGRVAMIRQLQPDVHIESDGVVASKLRGKVANIMYVDNSKQIHEDGYLQQQHSIPGVAPITPDYTNFEDCCQVLQATFGKTQ